jgi:ubiquinone/menaquinone biosynthesis C-methylase UbiE
MESLQGKFFSVRWAQRGKSVLFPSAALIFSLLYAHVNIWPAGKRKQDIVILNLLLRSLRKTSDYHLIYNLQLTVMSTFNSKHHGSKCNANKYSEINNVQLQYGKTLAAAAGVKRGHKVLDMGCGTGELTSFLAQKVGEESQVVGVDPDLERIKFAIQKHSENITFKHGDSSSQFPHFNEQYYDIHFSNFVFQWLTPEEKEIFVQTAFKCLKPGGKIAIQSHEDDAEIVKEAKNLFPKDTLSVTCDVKNTKEKEPFQYFVKKSETEKLLQKSGFVILASEYYQRSYTFCCADEFLAFVFASDYYDKTKVSFIKKKEFMNKFVHNDGTLTLFVPSVYQIVARKIAD